MAVKSVIDAVRDTLGEEMRRDPRIILLGEDVGALGGVFRATDGLLKEFGPERVIDTPLAESAIVGVAIGASLNGLRPIAEIQFADFIYPAMNQIISEAARYRYRSNGAQGCPMVIRAPYGGGIRGGLYHSQSLEAFFCHVPGLKVVAPSTPYDTAGLLRASLEERDPIIFFEHKKTYRLIKGEVPDGRYVVPIGSAAVRRQGRDLTVIAFGLMAHYALEAAERAAKDGIEAEVIDLRTLKPLDEAAILESVKKTSKALIVHEDTLTGGLGGEIAALIAEKAFEYLDGPVRRLAAPDVPTMPFSRVLEEFVMPDARKIERAIRELAAY